jgi:hypothetical protein
VAPSKAQRARRAEFARYKDDVKREGKPFFPYAMLHDTIMSLVVVLVIIGLACVWYFSAGDTEEGKGLLRIFKWPETVVLGTVGIPTILLIFLLGLPFYDRSRERRPLRRPVAMVTAVIVVLAMGVLTWKGATAEEALGSELIAQGLPEQWAEEQGFTGNEAAEAGATLFAQSGCLNCHTYLGTGSGNLGAPDLSDVGTSDRGVEGFKAYLANPAQFGNTVMISYAYLGDENLTYLGAFLNASKGGQQAEP